MSRSLALQVRPKRRVRAAVRAFAGAALVVALAACGGAGGGGNSGSSGQVLAQALAADPNAVLGGGATGIAGNTAFEQTVYPLLTGNCQSCHGGSGPGFPHISHPDVDTAYRAVVDTQKVDLLTPANSRLVLRMDPERHHCWSANCADDAMTLEVAIEQWAQLVAAGTGGGGGTGGATGGNTGGGGGPTIPVNVIASETLALSGAAGGQGGGRVETNVIALWNFRTGSGDVAFDTSLVDPAIDLTLTGTEWISGGGIQNMTGKAQAPADTSRKLFDRIADQATGSQEYSIEAWVVPGNVEQEGPARIVSYSEGTSLRNFTLGQENYNYVFRNRSSAEGVGRNGTPALETADADEDLQAVLQHVVATFDETNGRRLYVNGAFTDDVDAFGPGLLTNWNPEYRFVLGNETTDNRLWMGQIRMVAIHDAALTPAQVVQNYQAGVGEKFVMRFPLDQYLGAGSFIEFEVSEFDAFSYLFCFPSVVTPSPSGMVEGIRIAVNGVAPVMSQSFARASTALAQANQPVSDLCSVVPKDRGPADDQFTIFFEVLGAYENRIVEQPPVIAPDDSVAAPSPGVGIRDFVQVNDTMATLTGVDPLTSDVSREFEDLTQQLPGTTDIMSFVSSQQVAIFKLGLEYCDTLVDSSSLRQAFFGPDFEFGQPVPTAFSNQTKRDLIIGALVDRMVGTGLASQPTRAELQPVLDGLIDQLVAGCDAATCPAETTRTVVKGMCAAVLSSAAVHVQ